MKKAILLVLLVVIFGMVACNGTLDNGMTPTDTKTQVSEEQADEPTVQLEPSAMPSELPTTTPIPTETPWPQETPWPKISFNTSPAEADPNQYIPDIIIDSQECYNSNDTLIEDDEHIYYLWHYSDWTRNSPAFNEPPMFTARLVCIDKRDGKIIKIIDDCYAFSAHEGKVYYTDRGKKCSEGCRHYTIKEYNVRTREERVIVNTLRGINGIVNADGCLYYTTYSENLSEMEDVLFTILPGWGHHRKIAENVDTFCIYNDRIFAVTTGDHGYLVECHLYDESNVVLNLPLYEYFDISHGKIVCAEGSGSEGAFSNNVVYDMQEEKVTVPPPNGSSTGLLGQYMLSYAEREEGHPALLRVYDYNKDQLYSLLEIENLDRGNYAGIHQVKDHIYMCFHSSNYIEIYQVTIENGKASVDEVTRFLLENTQ